MPKNEDLTEDRFLGGRLRLLQPRVGYRAGIDPVLLAAAVSAQPGQSVLDLGCGVGTASLCLGVRVPGVELIGVELQPLYADLAGRNAAANGIPLAVVEADIAQPPAPLRSRSFDHVIMNPPFFQSNTTRAPDPGRDAAQREGGADLQVFLDQAIKRLVPGGTLTVIHRVERLGDILGGINGRAGGISIVPLAARSGRPAKRVIVRAIKSRRTPLSLLAPLVLHSGDTHGDDAPDYTDAVRSVLEEGAALSSVRNDTP